MAFVAERHPHVVILHRVPHRVYSRPTGVSDNRHLKMAYHDGTLEVLSLRLLKHERASYRPGRVVDAVAERLELEFSCTRGTTFRRGGDGPFRGKGKEPDQSYYFANLRRIPLDGEVNPDAGNPPPDLWIEVDGRHSSAGRLPVYAALGVPEIWQYRSGTKRLRFLRPVGGFFESIDGSLPLPDLTPDLVLEALALGENRLDSEWLPLLREWVARTFPLPAGPG